MKHLPLLCILDADEQPVSDTQGIEISFPGDAIPTLEDRVNTSTGAGNAKIIWGDLAICGVFR
ncbi:hypothetical protein [Novosphingobium sp. P6W]|uniref:hypothetical protein n=1 Tax=Novosphingobium sp. P6W TaxID=1609758 RepID=UPI001F0707F9|nr:hypothetical protein [Novosphingobium sp. P6W]